MKPLVQAATLGTARFEGEAMSGLPVDELLPGTVAAGQGPDPERRLLLLAGAAAAFRRAGAAAGSAAPLPPAEMDPRAPCSPAATGLLQRLLERRDAAVLEEAFRLLRDARLRVPHGLVPSLLDLPDARRLAGLREAAGARGRWLAALREDWSWARLPADTPGDDDHLDGSAERLFQEGRLEERRAALEHRRRTLPDTARGWLEEVWPKEKADVRAGLLESLAVGLSSRDEPFLEAALEDRSGAVRGVAARLLARISGSALGRRMVERADAIVGWTAAAPRRGAGRLVEAALRLRRAGKLEVNLPAEIDRTWERDGIAGKPPPWLGERAHRLALVLGLVDPRHWEERFGAAPAEIAGSAWATDWGLALVLGWIDAARLHGAAAWAGPLHDALAAAPKEFPPAAVAAVLEPLLALMPRHDLGPRVARALEGEDPLGVSGRLSLVPSPWDPALARSYLEGVRRELQSRSDAKPLSAQLPLAARAFAPESLGEASSLLELREALETALSPARFDEFSSTIELRKRMYEEIHP
jgi:hypothetical protein